jgi:hypothetical protein
MTREAVTGDQGLVTGDLSYNNNRLERKEMIEYTLVPGGVTAVPGFKATGIHAGLKKVKKDLALIVSEEPAVGAGVFTTNIVKAAPLLYDMEQLKGSSFRAIVVNSGNANACTGEQGLEDAKAMAVKVACQLGCPTEEVLVSSTGVICVNVKTFSLIVDPDRCDNRYITFINYSLDNLRVYFFHFSHIS